MKIPGSWTLKSTSPPFEPVDSKFDLEDYFADDYGDEQLLEDYYNRLSHNDFYFLFLYGDEKNRFTYKGWCVEISTPCFAWCWQHPILFEFEAESKEFGQNLTQEAMNFVDNYRLNIPSPGQLIIPGLEALVA